MVRALVDIGSHSFLACTTASTGYLLDRKRQQTACALNFSLLSNDTQLFLQLTYWEEGGVLGARTARGDDLTATMVDAFRCIPMVLTALLLSNGSLFLACDNGGNNFAVDDVALTGCITPSTHGTRVALNAWHSLCVLATHAGSITCEQIMENLALANLWSDLERLKLVICPASVCQLGRSADEEMLSAGLCHFGIVVIRHSCVCVYSSLHGGRVNIGTGKLR
ncbi:hypothetical protein ERJ75_001819000 [Trypanosoma vivax]|nr:hypothetical protein ERJ75_001819000 [Trypanosoma vivax]